MTHLDMEGPFYLLRDEVFAKVHHAGPGVFALGRTKDDGSYLVQFVGRSDEDINAKLVKHADDGRYPEFMFCYSTSGLEAFEKECKVFHRYAPEDNRLHPHRAPDSDWKCPGCEFYD